MKIAYHSFVDVSPNLLFNPIHTFIRQCVKYRKTGKFDYPWSQTFEGRATQLGVYKLIKH